MRDGGGGSQGAPVGACRHRSVTPRDIRRQECRACRQELERRRLVIDGPDDPRVDTENFRCAPGVFPNNDVKYEVSKLRAAQCARVHEQLMVYVPARDAPTPDALRERPDLPLQKMA